MYMCLLTITCLHNKAAVVMLNRHTTLTTWSLIPNEFNEILYEVFQWIIYIYRAMLITMQYFVPFKDQ